jgi:hypothetical protein
MERSAETFMDGFVVEWLAANDPELRNAIMKHRRRKLTARAGSLRLVESDRNKRALWASVTLPGNAPLPVSEEVGRGVAEMIHDVEGRLYEHLAALPSQARSRSPARSSACSPPPSACSRCSPRTRSPRSASTSHR